VCATPVFYEAEMNPQMRRCADEEDLPATTGIAGSLFVAPSRTFFGRASRLSVFIRGNFVPPTVIVYSKGECRRPSRHSSGPPTRSFGPLVLDHESHLLEDVRLSSRTRTCSRRA